MVVVVSGLNDVIGRLLRRRKEREDIHTDILSIRWKDEF